MNQKIDIVVINDLVTDNRVDKIANSLLEMGFSPTLTGRVQKKSLHLEDRKYSTHRMKLLFEKGPFFYTEFNIRLFFRLLFSNAEIILSNDLDTLPAAYFASKLKGKKLVYDSHEYFTEVPELINRPKTQKIWEKIESFILPKVKNAYTVCGSIAQIYKEKYNVPFRVVRNLPVKQEKLSIPPSEEIDKKGQKIILYQGALNIGRGLECAIKAMQFMEGTQLWIAGDGDIKDELKNLAKKLNVCHKVNFLGRIPLSELKYITAQADLGISIEEDMGLNYRYALPNKLFDYIQQHIPVMVSNLPEMKNIVDKYKIGSILKEHEPKKMAEQFNHALFNKHQREKWLQNLEKAALELCWENELKTLDEIYSNLQ